MESNLGHDPIAPQGDCELVKFPSLTSLKLDANKEDEIVNSEITDLKNKSESSNGQVYECPSKCKNSVEPGESSIQLVQFDSFRDSFRDLDGEHSTEHFVNTTGSNMIENAVPRSFSEESPVSHAISMHKRNHLCSSFCYTLKHKNHEELIGDHQKMELSPSTTKIFDKHADFMIPSENVHSKCASSSGCSHSCCACHVRVKVELSCCSSSEKSTASNGISRRCRPFPFPKRIHHKVKPPTKDLNSNKKKSPWSFRLNCRLRANKKQSFAENTSATSCVSCVCPQSRADPEPVYNAVSESCDSNEFRVPLPSSFISCVGHQENSNLEIKNSAHDIDIHQDLFPLVRDTTRSLGLPFSYNSMLDLQVLLESSLKLGLGSPRLSDFSCTDSDRQNCKLAQNTGSSICSRTVHTQVDYVHNLVPDLLDITNCDFYWGKMDRYEAENLLESKPEGTFLLRDSAQEDYLFSVSFRRYGRSLHARIEQWNHKFSFDSHDPGVFASNTVCGLIEHYKDPFCCMFFEPLLTHPLSRTFPFSLQHLCRAVICDNISYDGFNSLELPKSVKNYLKEYHYKQQVRVRHLD